MAHATDKDPALLPAAGARFLRRILTVLIAATIGCGAMAMSLAVNANPEPPALVASAQVTASYPDE